MTISSPWESLIQPPRSCYISHILYLLTSQMRYKLSKIAVLGCKNHLNTVSKNFHRLELGGAAPLACFGGQRSNASREGQREHFT